MPRVTVGREKQQEEGHLKWPIIAILLAAFALRVVGMGYSLPFPASAEERRVVKQGFDFTVRAAQKQRAHFEVTGLEPTRADRPAVMSYILAGEYGTVFGAGYVLGRYKFLHDYEGHFYKSPALFYILGRLTSVFFGLLSIYAVYRLCRTFFEWGVGVMAAFLLAVEPHHVEICQRATGDTLALVFAVIGLYYLVSFQEENRLGATFLGAAFVGFAASVQFWYAALAVFALVAYIATVPRSYKTSAWLLGLPFLAGSFLFGMLLPNGMMLAQWRGFVAGVANSIYLNGCTGALLDPTRSIDFAKTAVSTNVYNEGLGWGLVGAGVIGLLWGLLFAKHKRAKFLVVLAFMVTAGALFFPWDRETSRQWCYVISVPLSIGAAHIAYRICWRKWMPAAVGVALMVITMCVIGGQCAAQAGIAAMRKGANDTRYVFAGWAMENLAHRSRVLVTPDADVLFRAPDLKEGSNWATWRDDIMSAWNGRGFWVKAMPAPYTAAKAPEFREYDYVVVDSWSLDRIRAAGPAVGEFIAGAFRKMPALGEVSEAIASRSERAKMMLEAIGTLRGSSELVKSIPPAQPGLAEYGPGVEVFKVMDAFPRQEVEEEVVIHPPVEIKEEPPSQETPARTTPRGQETEERTPRKQRPETGEREDRRKEASERSK